jgi:hypothetical protein
MKEEWKDIPGYEGLYQVSNLGRVKSLGRYRNAKNGSKAYRKGLIKKTYTNKKGYLTLSLSKNGISKTFTIHQLVAIVFLNHIPDGMNIIVDHIDNNKLNNCVDNLQLITNRENSSKDKKNCSSKYTGVSIDKRDGRINCEIRINGDRVRWSNLKTEEYASLLYQTALKYIVEYKDIKQFKNLVKKIINKYE